MATSQDPNARRPSPPFVDREGKPIPQYVQAFWDAIRPLVYHAPHGWAGRFVELLANGFGNIHKKGEISNWVEHSMKHDAGRIQVLSMLLDGNERYAVLDLVEAVLMGDKTAKRLLNIITAAYGYRESDGRKKAVKTEVDAFYDEVIVNTERGKP